MAARLHRSSKGAFCHRGLLIIITVFLRRAATTINTLLLRPFGLFAIARLESVNYLSESDAEISRPGSFADSLSTEASISGGGGQIEGVGST